MMAGDVYRVAQHGAFLATRHSGRLARQAVEALLAELPIDRQVTLDFAGVEAVTGGFADELVANLICAGHGLRIAVAGANAEVAATIDQAVERRTDESADTDWDAVDDALRSPPERPSPFELWQQAGGDGERYRELMREAGHLVPGPPTRLPCGWRPGERPGGSP